MTTFVLVPGACHGGWWYRPLVDLLAEHGHRADAITLAGLGDQPDPATGPINLDTHIAETTTAVVAAGEPVVLVGHSYAGTVITATADRVPDRVRALVYLDAFVPEDGDSCYAMTTDEQRRWYVEGAGADGLGVAPLSFFDGRARPHPIGTLLQRVRLTGAWRSVPGKHYALATEWPGESPFAATAARLRAEPDWVVRDWATRHNVLHDGPRRVFDLLVAV